MSEQVVLNQAVLEFHGSSGLPTRITRALEKKLHQADWTELLKPVLQDIPANIRVVDASGPAPIGGKSSKARTDRKNGKFSVEITRIGYCTKAFEISDATVEDAERIALEQACNHEFTETHSEYEVQSICKKA